MAAPTLSTLLARASLEDDDEVLQAANTALKQNKGNLEAQHARAVALLKLDRFDDALRAFESGGAALQARAALPWAYALYKGGRLAEAEAVVDQALAATDNGDETRGLRHLLAQATYKLEKFDRAASLYRELARGTPEVPNEPYDLNVNAGATDAQLEWAGLGHLVERKKPTREDMEAFETAYNAACGSIARGELGQGEVLLKRAKDLCNAVDDMSEEEKKAELIPITVQQVYLLGRLGRLEEAEQLCSSINISEISDLAVKQAAQVNALVSTPGPANPFLTHRIFHSSPGASGSDGFFSHQSSIIRQDSYVIELQALKVAGVAKSTNTYLSKSSLPTTSPEVNTVSVLNAAASGRLKSGKEGINAIKPLLEKRPNDAGPVLTLVQLYVQSNNLTSAIETLEGFLGRLEAASDDAALQVRFAPGLVGTLVSLYSRQGRSAHIRRELAKAAEYWSSSSIASPELLKAAGESLLASDHEPSIAQAQKIFESLHERDAADKTAVAGLVSALALAAPEKVPSDLLSSVTPAERLIGDIDAAALEAEGVPRLQPPMIESKKRPADKTAKEAARKSKKIRPSRMPENFDPNKQPDPERWLPLRDRSTYRPKKKKGKGGATQGGTQGAADDKGAAGGNQAASGGGGGGGGGKKKKSGKKGKK